MSLGNVKRSLAMLGALLTLLTQTLSAQVVTSTIYGVVTDPTGASVTDAEVTVTHEGTGATASSRTGPDGEFTFTSLQPGTYTVRITKEGFKVVRLTGIDLASGARIRSNFALEVGSLTTSVDITAAAPLVNAATVEQRSNLSTLEVRQLPTSRRDWTNLLSLNTGVTVTGGTVSLNGLAPASFRITVDGTDSASDTELPSLSQYQDFNFIKGVSLEAVGEVNVAKGIASAEIANTMSGNVNINTRSGTNDVHGSLFYLNQNENLNARNQFVATKPPVVYNQFGGSLGGPVVRNRLFLFGVYEGYRLRGFQTVSGNVPTPEFRQQAIAAVPAYKQLLDLFPLPTNPYQPGAAAAVFQGAGSEKGKDNHAIVRGDVHATNNTILTARYTRGRPIRDIPRLGSLQNRTWSGASEVGTFNATHARARWVAETRFGYNYNRVNRLDNIYALGVPGVGGGVGFSAGGENFFKEGANWTLEEVIGTSIGRHSLRFGALFGRLWAGRENIETPDITYANAADFLQNLPNRVQVTFGVNQYRITDWWTGFFIQDDFKINRHLVLNLGIRYDYYAVPRERDNRLFNRNEPFGMGNYRDPESIWNADYNNFSPRIGFAYSPGENQRTVIRGGAGVFHNPRPMFGGPVDLVQNALDEPFRVIYSRADVLQFGAPLRFPVVNANVLQIAKGPSALLAGTSINPDWGYPYSYQWTLGFQRELLRNMAIEANYVGTRGLGLMMVRTMNPPDRVTGVRPNPSFATFRYRDSSESTNYHALQTSLRKRFSHGFNMNVNYTWSRNMSYTSDADLLLPGSPQDIWNVRAEYGPSNIDVRHRFVLDYVYELPFASLTSSRGRLARLALGGWQLSGIFTAQTGSPLNITQPSGIDSSRPDYVGGEPILPQATETLRYIDRAAFATVPLSSVSGLPIRPGNLGRNALYGFGFWNLDMNLAKSLAFTERFRVQLRLEALNALNHTNLSGIQTDISRANFGNVTSTRGARVIQLGGRLEF